MLALASLLLCALPHSDARAGGFSNLDFGTRRVGMRAVVANSDDPTAIVHNPAAMTLLDGTQVYTFLSVNVFDIAVRFYDSQGALRPDRNIEPDRSSGYAPFIGGVSDFGLERFRLGVAVYAPNVYGAAMPSDEPSRYHVIEALFLASRLTTSAAYAITDRFSLGASVHLVHIYLSASRVMSPLVLQDPDNRFLPVSETQQTDARLEISGHDLSWGWDVGLLFRPLPELHLGASFSSGSAVELEGDVRLEYFDGTVERSRHQTVMAIPLTLRAGLSWELAESFELAAEAIWWHYQVYQEQRSTLSDPIMGFHEIVSPTNYHNSWAWCVGLLYRVIEPLELMLGFQQDFTPIPSRTMSLENPGEDWVAISGGVRWQIDERFRVGLALSRKWYVLIDIQDSVTTPPTNIKSTAALTVVAFDFNWRF